MACRWPLGKRLLLEISTRVALFAIFAILEGMEPVHREILEEEMPLYSHKAASNTVTTPELITLVVAVPLLSILMWAFSRNDATDLMSGILALSLALALNGVVTNVLKITVGRPRPDFMWRCFPNGSSLSSELVCEGSVDVLREGRKSFPSGHTSWMFTGFVFTSLYYAGKLFVFSTQRGNSVSLIAVMAPIVGATIVGVSRITDRRHHWDDVLAGAILGTVMAAVAYFQFYPSLGEGDCDSPLKAVEIPGVLPRRNSLQRRTFSMSTLSESADNMAAFEDARTKHN